MAVVTGEYAINFSALASANPYLPDGWVKMTGDNNFKVVNGSGLHSTANFGRQSAVYDVEFGSVITAKFEMGPGASNFNDPLGIGIFIRSGVNTGTGFWLRHNSTALSLEYRLDDGSFARPTNWTDFANTSPLVGDTYELIFTRATGVFQVMRNGASLGTRTLSTSGSTYLAGWETADIAAGVVSTPENANNRYIASFAADGMVAAASGPVHPFTSVTISG
jgi:hypothetical protein